MSFIVILRYDFLVAEVYFTNLLILYISCVLYLFDLNLSISLLPVSKPRSMRQTFFVYLIVDASTVRRLFHSLPALCFHWKCHKKFWNWCRPALCSKQLRYQTSYILVVGAVLRWNQKKSVNWQNELISCAWLTGIRIRHPTRRAVLLRRHSTLKKKYRLALRSGITVASEVHPRRGYCWLKTFPNIPQDDLQYSRLCNFCRPE